MKNSSALPALILLPLFFLLHNYNELFRFIPLPEIIYFGLIIYGLTGSCFVILKMAGIPNNKIFLILITIACFLLFFSPIHEAYRKITFDTRLSSYWVLLPILFFLIFLVERKIVLARSIDPKLNSFLNLAMFCIVLFECTSSFGKIKQYRQDHNLIYPGKSLFQEYIPSQMPDSSKPDIYFFVFDEYTNNNALKVRWGFDNNSITSWLDSNGFYIPSNTRCNYSFTVFSISSAFNMNYIPGNAGKDGTVVENIMKGNNSMSDNETFSILKKEGYKIRFIAPFRNSIEENGLGHFFDYLVDGQIPGQTLPGSLSSSILSSLRNSRPFYNKDSVAFDEKMQEKFESVQHTIREIEATVDSSKNRPPHFVYGHILVPHTPHLYDTNGKFLTYTTSQKPLYHTYIAQVKWANLIIREIVGELKIHNKKNTIILIEGDHGFRRFPDSLSRWELPNFYAAYFPDGDYSMLYDSISPVNSFRVVFDHFFGQHFPLLRDSSTVVKDYFY